MQIALLPRFLEFVGTEAGKQNSGSSSHPSLEMVQIIFLGNLVIPIEHDPA